MQITKPKLQRVYVQVVDADTKKSLTRTVYGATPKEAMRKIIMALSAGEPRKPESAAPPK